MPSEKRYTVKELLEARELINAVDGELVTKDNTPATVRQPNPYTTGGFLSLPGARPEIFSAIPRPRSLLSYIPVNKATTENEILAVLTAASAMQGTNPSDYCGNPALPGNLATGRIVVPFGQLFVGQQTVVAPLSGMRANRAVQPATIINNVANGNPFMPDLLKDPTVNFASDEAFALYNAGIAVERALDNVAINGDNTLGSTNTTLGWIKEYNGLRQWVKTGYTDAVSTGTTLPAMDSQVIAWSAALNGTVGGINITAQLTDLYFGRDFAASQLGMPNVQFAFVMSSRVFRELVYIYACQYATTKCAGASAGSPVFTAAQQQFELQQEWLKGQYLTIDGINVPVIFDDSIPVTWSGGVSSSSIFLLPISYGGFPLMRLDYKDMNNPPMQFLNQITDRPARAAINDGMYLISSRSTGFCDDLLIAGLFRFILETPWLAGRIDGVQFASNIGFRDPFPGNSGYVSGGVTTR